MCTRCRYTDGGPWTAGAVDFSRGYTEQQEWDWSLSSTLGREVGGLFVTGKRRKKKKKEKKMGGGKGE